MKRLILAGLSAGRTGCRRFLSTKPPTASTNCPSKVPTKVPCPQTTPKGPVEAPKDLKNYELPAADKKCPVFCCHGTKQCPPLVPPVVRPKKPLTPFALGQQQQQTQQQIPTAALMAYRLTLFGAKVGIAAFCLKWTIDNHIWGNSSDTKALWDQYRGSLYRVVPMLNPMNSDECGAECGSQFWNKGVISTFDKFDGAARSLRRFAVEKENSLLGEEEVVAANVPEKSDTKKAAWKEKVLQWFRSNKGHSPPPSDSTSYTNSAQKLTLSEPEKDEAAFKESVAPGECHLALVITEPANQVLHRDDGQPLPEEPKPVPPPPVEVEELEPFEAAGERRRVEGAVRTFCCQVHQLPPDTYDDDTQVKMKPCGKPDCPVCPMLVVD